MLFTLPKILTNFDKHWAVGNGHYQCTKVLLEYGVGPNSMSDTSVTPLDIAVSNKLDTIVDLLMKYQAKRASEMIGRKLAVICLSLWLTNNLQTTERAIGNSPYSSQWSRWRDLEWNFGYLVHIIEFGVWEGFLQPYFTGAHTATFLCVAYHSVLIFQETASRHASDVSVL